jgi:outer membrane protein assembly factor BamD
MRKLTKPARHQPRAARSWGHLAVSLLLAGLVTACAIPEEKDRTAGWTVEQIYEEARGELDAGRYEDAVKLLEILESRYPFGRYAQQAQIDIAWAHYRDGERGLSLAAIDRFIKLHPDHPKMDYIYYLKGLVNFNERDGLLQRLGGQDLSERDLQAARESFDAFKTVATRFPTSKYVPDAQQRMRHLVNSLAAGEVSVARFYFQRNAYVAAANRAQEVVRQYQQVPAVEEALYIMMRSYDALGLEDLSDGARRVLEKNFPQSEILANGIATERPSWWQVWR